MVWNYLYVITYEKKGHSYFYDYIEPKQETRDYIRGKAKTGKYIITKKITKGGYKITILEKALNDGC